MKLLVESRLPSKWGEYVMAAYGEEGDPYPHVVLHSNLEQLKRGRVAYLPNNQLEASAATSQNRSDPMRLLRHPLFG